LKEVIRWDIELNIEDFFTGKRNLLTRIGSINEGHYPNYASDGQRDLWFLPVGNGRKLQLNTLLPHDNKERTLDIPPFQPIDGFQDSGEPFPTQTVILNKEVGLIRELVNEPRLLDIESITPYNLLAKPPEQRSRTPLKYWNLSMVLADQGYYLGTVGNEAGDWFYNVDSIIEVIFIILMMLNYQDRVL
jgi:hypothetical protein